MKISVVIPMYNSKDTIINTLNSIKCQTALDQIFEIIVVNDGSTDNSLDLVYKYKKENEEIPIVVIDKPNGGVSSARNAGMKVVKGEWIALLDADDEWIANKIEIQVKTIINNPEIDFLGGDISDDGLKILWRRINGLYKAKVKDICLKMFPQPSVAIFKSSIFKQIGGFDEKQKYAEDGNYFMKVCSKYNYFHLPLKLVEFGGGKPGFGHSGLSGNLKGMYDGNVKNIKELKKVSVISVPFYLFLRVFYYLKYIRRIIITKTRRVGKQK
jgi:glycosyltransferase involved in cell wall biosynthesis